MADATTHSPETTPQADAPASQPGGGPIVNTPRRSRRGRGLALATIGLMVIAAVGVWYWRSMGWESTDNAQIDGFIYPISARVSGHVSRVMVDENQYVEAGTVLAQLDPKDYEVAIAVARATLANDQASAAALRTSVPITSTDTASQLSTAQADVQNTTAGLGVAQRQFEAAQATLREAEANDLKAQDDVVRYAPLAAMDEIPQRQYSQAVNSQRATAAAVEAAGASAAAAEQTVTQARARLAQAQAQLRAAGTRPEQIAGQRARAQAAEAQSERSAAALQQAQLNLQYTTIVAPVSGIVGQRSVQPGQNVSPGQQLMTVVPLDSHNIWVTANFKETQLKYMRPGQPVRISVDAYGRSYQGRVLNIAGASGARYSLLPPENATGNYVKVVQRIPVKIVFDEGQDAEQLLRLGMSVEPSVRIR
jgi:membrane fusion protein, multidrug efflux system